MKTLPSQLFQLILSMIVFLLGACSQNQEAKKEISQYQQGQASWVNAQTDMSEVPKPHEFRQISHQKIIDDLHIIPTIQDIKKSARKFSEKISNKSSAQQNDPSSYPSTQVFSEIHELRMHQKPYSVANVRFALQQLKDHDQKISADISIANKKINFQNESTTLIQIFKALVNLNSNANIPLLNRSTNKVEKIIQVPVGGELNDYAKQVIQQSQIEQCHDVLCALSQLMILDQSPSLVFPEQTAKKEDAAYQLIFNAIYHRYLIPFYVPRISEFSPQSYQTNLRRFEIFNTDQIHLISEALWKLPPTFDQMSSLLYFLADNKNFAKGEVTDGKGIQTIASVATAHYYWSSHYRPDNLQERWGFIVLDNQKWGRYESDFIIQLSNGVHALSSEELQVFEPDIRQRIKRKHLDIPLHEISHAMDYANLGLNKGVIQGFQNSYPSAYSHSVEWLGLSQWKYSSTRQNRDLKSYNLLFTNLISVAVTYINEWSHGTLAKFVDSYAETDPVEDFAVHSAGYILFPEETMTYAEKKAQYLIQNIFTGNFKGSPFQFQYKKEIVSADSYATMSDQLESKRYKINMKKCLAYSFSNQNWFETLESYCQNLK